MNGVFSRILAVELPPRVGYDPATATAPEVTISVTTDGEVPFGQAIVRGEGGERLIRDERVVSRGASGFEARTPAGWLRPGRYEVQVEGCRRAEIATAGAADWIKWFGDLVVEATAAEPAAEPGRRGGASGAVPAVRVYFGIHKHLHQPYYDACEPWQWDGEKEAIFGSREGPYTRFLPAAVRQYLAGGLPHAGLSTSFSGTLLTQLERCAHEGRCGGRFERWSDELRDAASLRTELGSPRLAFTAFGFHHPLLPLIPERDLVRSLERHREQLRSGLGVEPSRILFPPETAFHVRMIPALRRAGIEVVIYDSIHRYRACRSYPYAGPREGLLPPNRAEQTNPPVADWTQLHGLWAPSPISPSLLRPELIAYESPAGEVSTIIGIPAERYLGNEDARGGFGALQYPNVLGQLHARIVADGTFDPAHPPFFLLHSDGDNHGGGADSYYQHNTGRLVEWLRSDPRFELTTIDDYLARFPPDPQRIVHIEPGSWSGADHGDPQFSKWFSRSLEAYSPDLNSWAVLTALQNLVHSLEDAALGGAALPELIELLLRAETSCYWYWTGQETWDRQVTRAANRAVELAAPLESELARRDRTGPTLFPPWITPANPGGEIWGAGGLVAAPRAGTVHTFIHDVVGVARAWLVLRTATGERTLDLVDRGPYPSQTGARVSARYFTAELGAGLGDVRYFIEAEDTRGNRARGALERIFLA